MDCRGDDTDEGISGAREREKRPSVDALLAAQGCARREFDIVGLQAILNRAHPCGMGRGARCTRDGASAEGVG